MGNNTYKREDEAKRKYRDPVCRISAICGSCTYINDDYEESLNLKYQNAMTKFEAAGLTDRVSFVRPIASPRKLSYRTLFKLAVRAGKKERFDIGLFKPGTHDLVQGMESCPIHAEPLTHLIYDLKRCLNESPLIPFDEQTQTGDLRYVVARSASMTGEISLVFVVTEEKKQEYLKIVQALRKLDHKINSAHMNLNTSKGNEIFSGITTQIVGLPALRERVCNLDIDVPPTAFFQINPWQAQNIYRRIEQHVGEGSKNQVAWDLYCGLGQIGLILARNGFRTLGIEENEAAIHTAKQNAVKNDLKDRAEFIALKVEESESKIPEWAKNPEVIVVNPSRRGLHEAARSFLGHLIRTKKTKFYYVSCDTETFIRDLTYFKSIGIRLLQVEAFDMFAHTDKLEWLGVLKA